jgi:prepilin-type N-terminal cleavage/methylation domain-containing protein
MKLKIPSSGSGCDGSPTPASGFTLPEILIAMTVLGLVVAGILAANLFGMRMVQTNETKLSATEWSRNTFGKITDQIHTCNSISILNVDTNDNFTGLLPGETQQGNALQIYPSTNTDSFTMYFVNLSDETFRRTVATPSGTNTVILADSVTNAIIFSAQDFSGNVLTNNQNNQVIHLTLDFYQPASYMQNSYYYQLETSVTLRNVP